MVVKITSLEGNGRQNYKFDSSKTRSVILLYYAGTDGITCGRKSRGDEKQLIDLEWPNVWMLRRAVILGGGAGPGDSRS